VDLERAYAPKVPKNNEIVTTDTVIIIVFIVALQNSPSIQESIYAMRVDVEPVSINVLKPFTAYIQLALEKKSALTLKEPQKVQMKGKTEMTNQKIMKILLIIINCLEYLFILDSILSLCFKFFPSSN